MGSGFYFGAYAHNHLLAAQERIADELARAQGHLAFGHVGGIIRGSKVVVGVGFVVSARLAFKLSSRFACGDQIRRAAAEFGVVHT